MIKEERFTFKEGSKKGPIYTARLGFKEEVAPKDYEIVKERMIGELHGLGYLNRAGFLFCDYSEHDLPSHYSKKVNNGVPQEVNLYVRRPILEFLAFDVKMESPKYFNPKDFLDLSEFNNYLLTGKSPLIQKAPRGTIKLRA